MGRSLFKFKYLLQPPAAFISRQQPNYKEGIAMESNQVTAEIRRLTPDLYATLEGRLCSICQTDFQVGQFLVGLTCDHGFHVNCLKGWVDEVS